MSRYQVCVAELLSAVQSLAPEQLPDLLGEIERIRAFAYARLPSLYNGKSAAKPEPTPKLDRLLTVEEIAERLGMTKRWVYDNADSLPFIRRIGSGPRPRIRASESALERYMATRK